MGATEATPEPPVPRIQAFRAVDVLWFLAGKNPGVGNVKDEERARALLAGAAALEECAAWRRTQRGGTAHRKAMRAQFQQAAAVLNRLLVPP